MKVEEVRTLLHLWILNRGHIHSRVHNIPEPRLNTPPPTLTPSSLFSSLLSVFSVFWFDPHPSSSLQKVLFHAHYNSLHICLLAKSLNCVLHHLCSCWEMFHFFLDAAVLWLKISFARFEGSAPCLHGLKMVSMIHGSCLEQKVSKWFRSFYHFQMQ